MCLRVLEWLVKSDLTRESDGLFLKTYYRELDLNSGREGQVVFLDALEILRGLVSNCSKLCGYTRGQQARASVGSYPHHCACLTPSITMFRLSHVQQLARTLPCWRRCSRFWREGGT